MSAVDCPEPFPHHLIALRCASATLSWSAPTTNADGTSLSDLTGYKVYSGVTSRTYGTPIDVGNRTTYTLTGLANGTQYYIAVKTYETSGNESGFSAEVPFPDRTLAANFIAIAISSQAPLTVTFTDSSSGNPTAWSWQFGDGGASTQHTVAYSYKNPGTYDVILTASNGSLSNTVTKQGHITVPQPSLPRGWLPPMAFHEGNGTTVNDTCGKGNHSAISAAQWTDSGRYRKALVFNGVNTWVTVNDAPSLDLTTGSVDAY